MKKAKLTVAMVEMHCPECNGNIPDPSGSYLFSVMEPIPKTGVCEDCQKTFILPKPKGTK